MSRSNEAWRPIETAPKDGTPFLARNAEHLWMGCWVMMRSVRYETVEVDGGSLIAPKMTDLGAWLHVRPIEWEPDDISDRPFIQSVPFSIAADRWNSTVRYEWLPLPSNPLADRYHKKKFLTEKDKRELQERSRNEMTWPPSLDTPDPGDSDGE